ncbi:S8/S53 family peptidase [Planctomycetota bacterium]|nr:S8/S53 family peptidase [Planctomycetota bacterium]
MKSWMQRKVILTILLLIVFSLAGSAGLLSYANSNFAIFSEIQLIGSVKDQDGKTATNQKKKLSNYDLIGYNSAKQRLGKKMPTGRGIKMGHVEGPAREYIPNTTTNNFKSVNFHKKSGQSKVSGHATATASRLYGTGGLAKGVTDVDLYSASDWMGKGYLKAGSKDSPVDNDIRIFSNSWIGGESKGTEHILRRVDYIVDRDGVIVVAGVNNGRNTQVPSLLGSSWNGIAVGTWGGKGSSGGYTHTEGEGRVKPDIVGVRDLTSFTTPLVSATAAMILEIADKDQDAEMAQPTVVKAMLLSGATKPWNWKPEEAHSLDKYFGAGVLNVNNTLMIAEGQKAEPSGKLDDFGWSYVALKPNQAVRYLIEKQDEKSNWGPLAITIDWNRSIQGPVTFTLGPEKQNTINRWMGTPAIADFDLRLIKIEDDGSTKIVAMSDSERDNVEHIYFNELPPGKYAIEILRQNINKETEPWPFALAWRIGGENWRGDN